MTKHELYLNLGENRWVLAHCSCGGWQQERMLKLGQRVSEVVGALEEEFERHAGLDPTAPYTPALPVG